ncbi:MAG: hypothetical protein A3K19_04890 [Lentisphaerae bacterium RIFOXYB12_FULL_65_16]|nr:MAG: hypothetical protein A3K18_15520 [Lentisphaerae bacterium RIFOXYA12_64_32]OGV89727.1 MAG: hypothetical protein A3K19_04890 [Lentisphaerae bacterium RIFOXYB12_FULL_65_16]
MEKLFASDTMTKRERVLATLRHQPIDRAALLEQLSYNPRVIADWTGKTIAGFDYTLDDICEVCRKTMDLVMPPATQKLGTKRVTSPDGWVHQYDNWTVWTVSRPFTDEEGGRDWLVKRIRSLQQARVDVAKERQSHRDYMRGLQAKLGDTQIFAYPIDTGLCGAYGDGGMGLEIFSYFYAAWPDTFRDYMAASMNHRLQRLHAIADEYVAVSPVVLIAEDFATKQGPIFGPAFLHEFHYPNIKRLADAWHEHGVIALYHSDGNWRKVIPDLIATGVDGFYCLEPNCGMDVVEFKQTWPQMVWAGGVDGVDLLERGTPEQVKREVHRHIRETNVLATGGMFVASSSEINPPIPPENFRAMVEAVGELRNPHFPKAS